MHIFSTGVQAVGGATGAGGGAVPTPVAVADASRPTKAVYVVELPAGFALTGGGVWDTLVAAATIPSAVTELEVFMAGSDEVELARGAPASEVSILRVVPGGNGRISVSVAAGERVAIRKVSAGPLTTGELVVNFYGP